MNSFLFLISLLALPARAQLNTLPQDVSDQATASDLSYLSQQVSNLTNQSNIAISSLSLNSLTITAGSTITINTVTTTATNIITIGNHPICSGLVCLQSSTSPVSTAGFVWAALDLQAHYKIYMDTITWLTSTGYLEAQFGNSTGTLDSGANHYAWNGTVVYTGAPSAGGSTGDTKCILDFGNGANGRFGVGNSGSMEFGFDTYAGPTSNWYRISHYDNDDTRWENVIGSCTYLASGTSIASVSILPSAGTFGGTFRLVRVE